ncbi:DUF2911 domain-containing protein [Pontibacter sp. G13]|uniref:DUF2911 domain-containing protein n=1 Tax=Pontibacter sp. G13 TaxID=3074898 RepID=UPI00288C3D48|nr:DUF2911 domain-containing protein [Pontibacter sp. G13]WNJ19338.1 DUF2911 domain-containing protein [Pontibacter sp. G13]
MKRVITSLSAWILMALMAVSVQAQIDMPAPSPAAKVEQTVGLTDVSVMYSRPGVKGRTVFGDLVPFDKVWRTGANSSTQITFSDDVKFGGKDVKAGTYALYSIPTASEWTFMLYSDLKLGGNVAKYEEANEVVRFTVPSKKLPMSVESMMFMFDDLTDNSATLTLAWESTMVTIDIETEVDSRVMKQIESTMAGPGYYPYFQAATYYYNTDRDLDKALEWINMSLEQGDRFWVMTMKARILGKKGDTADAIATAKKAKALAEEASNADYVKINSDLIAEWEGM